MIRTTGGEEIAIDQMRTIIKYPIYHPVTGKPLYKTRFTDSVDYSSYLTCNLTNRLENDFFKLILPAGLNLYRSSNDPAVYYFTMIDAGSKHPTTLKKDMKLLIISDPINRGIIDASASVDPAFNVLNKLLEDFRPTDSVWRLTVNGELQKLFKKGEIDGWISFSHYLMNIPNM